MSMKYETIVFMIIEHNNSVLVLIQRLEPYTGVVNLSLQDLQLTSNILPNNVYLLCFLR